MSTIIKPKLLSLYFETANPGSEVIRFGNSADAQVQYRMRDGSNNITNNPANCVSTEVRFRFAFDFYFTRIYIESSSDSANGILTFVSTPETPSERINHIPGYDLSFLDRRFIFNLEETIAQRGSDDPYTMGLRINDHNQAEILPYQFSFEAVEEDVT